MQGRGHDGSDGETDWWIVCGLRTFFPQQRGGWIRKGFPQRIQHPRSMERAAQRAHWAAPINVQHQAFIFFITAPTAAPTRSIKPANSVNKGAILNPITVTSMLRRPLLLYGWFPIVNKSTKLPLLASQPSGAHGHIKSRLPLYFTMDTRNGVKAPRTIQDPSSLMSPSHILVVPSCESQCEKNTWRLPQRV